MNGFGELDAGFQDAFGVAGIYGCEEKLRDLCWDHGDNLTYDQSRRCSVNLRGI